MKKTVLYILIVCALAAGCSFDEKINLVPEEGVLTKVTLSYGVEDRRVYTRSMPAGNEMRVANLYIMIFDSNGNRVRTTDDNGNDRFLFTDGSGMTVNSGPDGTSGTVSFNVGSMQNATVVAIANITSGNVTTVYTLNESDLSMDKIARFDDLKNLSFPAMASISRSNYFLMSGIQKGVTISPDNNDGIDISLKRIDAKVTVNITTDPADAGWTDFSFQPMTWKVHKVPLQSRLFSYEDLYGLTSGIRPQDQIGYDSPFDWDAPVIGGNGGYFDSQEVEFTDVTTEDRDNTLYYSGGSFSFYMPENREVAKRIAENYTQRDEGTPSDGLFDYANNNSTYLEIRGYLSYTDESSKVISADVTMYVHLGYVNSDHNDYETKQNGSYTYNISVKSVNSIIVEVEEGTESNPGYEGDVVQSDEVLEIDASYSTRLITLASSLDFQSLTWGVRTPFSVGIHDPSASSYDGVKDYKWIKFAINKHFGTLASEFVVFPGISRYTEGVMSADDIDGLVSNGEPPLMDIEQLLVYLREKEQDNEKSDLTESDGTIAVTAFVDEYLYTEDPEGVITGEPLTFWKKCVDGDDRQLYIISTDVGDGIYSEDGQSSYVNSLYMFKQKAIRTVFNKDASDDTLSTAWGLETGLERNRLEPGDVSSGSSTRDGRGNCIKWMVNKTWRNVINLSSNELNSSYDNNYNNAAYACLTRNRDENGNGTIDESEIKWYLAAIDQITDIYLGEWALNEASRLYPQDVSDRPGGKDPYWHYTTSSANGTDPWILWAEEGASRGTYRGDGGSLQLNGNVYSYRCIRNLGVDDNSEYTINAIQDLVIVDENTNSIDLSRMNPKALRGYTSSPLPKHNEKQEWNRVYTKFEYTEDTYPEPEKGGFWDGYALNKQSWQTYQTTPNPCPSGYRIPNQRELLIMSTRLSDNEWEVFDVLDGRAVYISYTGFSLSQNSNYSDIYPTERGGFLWDANKNVFMLQNAELKWWGEYEVKESEYGYVRCVRDVQQ